MHAIVILAAGLGRRFGGATHKALMPLQFGEGSLPRLLRQIATGGPPGPVVLVTGPAATAVTDAARRILPGLALVEQPVDADTPLLASLCRGLDSLAPAGAVAGAWGLFADTLYDPAVIGRILGDTPEAATVACQPRGATGDAPVGIALAPGGTRLGALGPGLTQAPWVMAPAVYWPRRDWPRLAAARRAGLRAQWQVLRDLPPGTVAALPCGADAIGDIDTPADLERRRTALIDAPALAYFRDNLSKEERTRHAPDRSAGECFLKTAESPRLAALEVSAMQWIARVQGPDLLPLVAGQEGRRIRMEHVRGIRLFDLLRLLEALGRADPASAGPARAAACRLLARCQARLGRMQQALLSWPEAPGLPPYAFARQVGTLLETLLRVLGLPAPGPEGQAEIAALAEVWDGQDCRIPFRDATPKNILVAIPTLDPARQAAEPARLAALRRWLRSGAAGTVRLVDYDFASVLHRTAPEDDGISLLAHRGSLAFAGPPLGAPGMGGPLQGPMADWPGRLPALPRQLGLPFAPDGPRTARALMVRYLRFGGRKLLYRAINPAGFALRFRHDRPEHYFATLPAAMAQLWPAFPDRFPILADRLQRLARCVSLLPAWCPSEAAQDRYLADDPQGLSFWQESPLERGGHG